MSEYIQDPAGPYINPYPAATTRWDYFQALRLNRELVRAGNDTESAITSLTRYVFETHPQVLDLPPAVKHRFGEAQRLATNYAGGSESLQASIAAYLGAVGEALRQGWAPTMAATIYDPDPAYPRPIQYNGQCVQRLWLPESIQQKALAWNSWMLDRVQAGETETVFANHPEWVSTKLATGAWLPVGNLMIEAGETLMRLRTPAHAQHDLEARWGLNVDDKDTGGPAIRDGIHDPELSQWFIMTHIVDKKLLKLSENLGPNMIDSIHLTPEVYARSYVPILELMDRNPLLNIRGVLSDGTWIYSSEVSARFPDQAIAGLHAIAGDVVDLGPADKISRPAQVTFATYNQERREAYLRGEYRVTVAARFIDREGMEAVVNQYRSS